MLLRAPAQAPLRGCYEMDLHARAREPVRTHAGARVKDITIRHKSDFAPYTICSPLADRCDESAATPRPHRHPDLRRRTLRSPHLLVGQPPFLPTEMLYNMELASERRCPRLEPLSEPRTSPVAENGQHDGDDRGRGKRGRRRRRGRGNSPRLESELGALGCR